MKTLRLIGMALFAVLMCVNFASCSSDDVIPNEQQNPKEYTVSLGFTGEICVSESPLSRASGDDLYGIQVYSCPDTEGSTTYTFYAYGLFDDTSLMSIKLLEGYKYKFEATMVVDGKNRISSISGKYSSPFNSTLLENKFIYSEQENIIGTSGINVGNTQLIVGTTSKSFRHPNIDRYHGETTDYVPAENSNVTIYMKRTVFGVKYIAENLSEGSLNIAMDDAPEATITCPETTYEDIYSLWTISNIHSIEDYSETISVTINWTKADGAVVPLGTHNITFKRNKLTTVTIKVADAATENGIGITIDDEEKNMGEGDNLTVETGKITDTTVGTETETEG